MGFLPGSVAAHPPDRGHRQASGAQRAGDIQGAWPLRRGARDVPDGQADRAACDHRDQQGQDGGVQRSHVHDRIHGDRRPQGIPPVRPASQANHGGVGDQARQVRIERRGVARARTGHDDRVVEPAGGGPCERLIDHRGHAGGQDAGGHRLAEPPEELAPDEQLDGHGHGQDEQGEERHRTGHHDHRGNRWLASTRPVCAPDVVALAPMPATASATIPKQDKTQRSKSAGLRMRRSS